MNNLENINIWLNMYPKLHTEKVSYAKNTYSNLKYINLFSPEQFESISESKTHLRFNCPYCVDVRGKEDKDGKFYWDKTKLIGYCFKCHSVGILKSEKPIEDIQYEILIDSFFKHISSNDSSFKLKDLVEIKYEELFEPLNKEGIAYLNSRIPKLYETMSNYFQFRVMDNVGITVPIILFDKVISYNLRYYSPKNKMKYFIPSGVKYLYSPNCIFTEKNKYCEITLVEGVFDACSALILGIKNPVCIFGSSVSDLQVQILRKLSPSIINIQLDETPLSYKLAKKLKNSFPTVQKINVKPSKIDAEEYLLSILLKSNSFQLKTIIDRVNFLLRNSHANSLTEN